MKVQQQHEGIMVLFRSDWYHDVTKNERKEHQDAPVSNYVILLKLLIEHKGSSLHDCRIVG